ncbi:hypothetical protein LNKW23_31900 [Paralimibaculum aggregatum]|uniref:Uncharacterized protein n=1 Tax=Paralimibaculum aggregatum TaxID=3036245 RepID=A0ABQ6LRP3_9RHOB|nr:hypothetical protein [Limibaculum sp. NKW23]GMG83976.1 hypothetical protein LNKW23_31900 [Limibaculum sp. NKW23]
MRALTVCTAMILFGGLSLAAGPSAAQQRPPKPDFSRMAATLAVSEADLMGCLGPRPQPGQRPPRPDAAKIAACLGAAGYDVTAQDTEAALAAAAPRRR